MLLGFQGLGVLWLLVSFMVQVRLFLICYRVLEGGGFMVRYLGNKGSLGKRRE